MALKNLINTGHKKKMMVYLEELSLNVAAIV